MIDRKLSCISSSINHAAKFETKTLFYFLFILVVRKTYVGLQQVDASFVGAHRVGYGSHDAQPKQMCS